MTTTEWVERYNRAFEQAGSDGWSYESTPCVDWTEEDHRAYNLMPPVGGTLFGDPAPGSPGIHEEIAIPSNPSPFDAHPGLDHQATDERALKGKETPL